MQCVGADACYLNWMLVHSHRFDTAFKDMSIMQIVGGRQCFGQFVTDKFWYLQPDWFQQSQPV